LHKKTSLQIKFGAESDSCAWEVNNFLADLTQRIHNTSSSMLARQHRSKLGKIYST